MVAGEFYQKRARFPRSKTSRKQHEKAFPLARAGKHAEQLSSNGCRDLPANREAPEGSIGPAPHLTQGFVQLVLNRTSHSLTIYEHLLSHIYSPSVCDCSIFVLCIILPVEMLMKLTGAYFQFRTIGCVVFENTVPASWAIR